MIDPDSSAPRSENPTGSPSGRCSSENEFLANTLDAIGDGVIFTDSNGIVTLINGKGETITGWNRDEVVSRPIGTFFKTVTDRHRECCRNPVEEVLSNGRTERLEGNAILFRKDGSERLIESSATPIRNEFGDICGAVFVFRDVTVRERIREEMHLSGRLESVGMLAAGVAHNFNNLLQAILGNVEFAKGTTEHMEVRSFLENAEVATLKARELTSRLLTFASGGIPVSPGVLSPDFLAGLADRALYGSNVTADISIADDLWPVEVDRTQVGIAIDNIIINACQASPHGGTIKISAHNFLCDEAAGMPLKSGKYVLIAVQDQGQGIPPDQLARVFEPFFKGYSSGGVHGLGLSIANSIITRHGGHIRIDSRTDKGTAVNMYLPVSSAHKSSVDDTGSRQSPFELSGRILVMDDELMVRQVLKEMISHLGYEVVTASDGAEAVEHYRQSLETDSRFDAVIVDMIVPGGMGGLETARRLLEMDPCVRMVLSSGYSDQISFGEHRKHGFQAALEKPYRIARMKETLAAVIVTS